jgi:hypothetical protein
MTICVKLLRTGGQFNGLSKAANHSMKLALAISYCLAAAFTTVSVSCCKTHASQSKSYVWLAQYRGFFPIRVARPLKCIGTDHRCTLDSMVILSLFCCGSVVLGSNNGMILREGYSHRFVGEVKCVAVNSASAGGLTAANPSCPAHMSTIISHNIYLIHSCHSSRPPSSLLATTKPMCRQKKESWKYHPNIP